MNIPLEVVVGLITLSGVLASSLISLLNSRQKNSSDQTIETMRIQKELIGTLFDENKVLSKRMDEIEESFKNERKEFQEELVKTREAYKQLKNIVEEAISLLKSDKHLEALKLLEK
jgi:hypothetical protein